MRALTRNLDKPAARALADQGAEVVAGDMTDPESLRRPLAGAGAVFCVTQFSEAGYDGEVTQGKLTTGYHADLNWLRQVNPQMVTLENYLRRHHWQP